jgi:ATP-dependent helicase/DNAse subunit B
VYLDCRLKFYLQYLANIQEKDEVKEEIDAAVFGNIAHYSMEFLYDGFRKRQNRDVLEKEDFEELRKNWVFPSIELGVRKFYHLEENADTKLSGQMAIVRDVMQKYMVRLLEIDEEDAPFRLLSMEKAHKAQFKINTLEGVKKISLKGFIDRVDEKEGTIRLIDYKSGGDKKVFSNVQSLFDRDDKNRNKAAMQTMYYGLLYQAMHRENTKPLKPALFNFKEIFQEDFNPYLQQKEPRATAVEVADYRSYQSDYESGLRTMLEEMYDPEVPFSQTDNVDKCKYCAYVGICGR